MVGQSKVRYKQTKLRRLGLPHWFRHDKSDSENEKGQRLLPDLKSDNEIGFRLKPDFD